MTTEDLACPNCHERELIKRGIIRRGENKFQRYECKRCGYVTIKPLPSELEPRIRKSVVKVLKSTQIKVKEK
jgi:transposase-like protein